MRLGLRIFGCYLVIFLVCFSYPIGWVMDTLRIRYLEGVEDPLVDQANILAGTLGEQLLGGGLKTADLRQAFSRIYARNPDARIYQLTKTSVDMRVYIADRQGRIVFDSAFPTNIGTDYSRWRDVRLTLEGQYGARSTLADADDPTSTVLCVAAPIRLDGRIAGVLTVAKPTTNINNFLKKVQPRFFRVAAVALAAAVGRRINFPVPDKTEIGDLGTALNNMQGALEGKAYIEQYVQKLTHEIKSPLSAIRGAAELLEEDVPAERRRRFLLNIRTEANRIQTIVDRMLQLAALEARKQLHPKKRIDLAALVKAVLESKSPMLSKKQLTPALSLGAALRVKGDPFLLHQALANLIQNAMDFSPAGGTLTVTAAVQDGRVRVTVFNQGPAIPAYALDKIFEKFFSLKRPDSGKKSTGLGLNFVKEVAELHNGRVSLENVKEGGVKATLELPL
ncbi:MAG: sensor histidine kinase [Desulfosarcinaceae bacterium]